jgi:hypothetical protein
MEKQAAENKAVQLSIEKDCLTEEKDRLAAEKQRLIDLLRSKGIDIKDL